MANEQIRAALEAAAKAVRCADAQRPTRDWPAEPLAAAAVAAFLRALPDDADMVFASMGPIGKAIPAHNLAAAVEEAVRDAR